MTPSRWMPWVPMLALALAAGACELVDTDELAAPREPIGSGGGQDGEATFSGGVQPILIDFCSACHNPSSMTGGVDATSYDGLLAKPGLIEPGDPDGSLLVQVLEAGIMPPAGRPRPTAEQVSLIRAWVAAGALDD